MVGVGGCILTDQMFCACSGRCRCRGVMGGGGGGRVTLTDQACFLFTEMQRSVCVCVWGGGVILTDRHVVLLWGDAEEWVVGGGVYTNRLGMSCLFREMERCAVIWWGWGRDAVG